MLFFNKKVNFIVLITITLSLHSLHAVCYRCRPVAEEFKWQEYNAEDSGFSIDLPTKPEHAHQKIDIPKTDLSITYDTYVSEPCENVVYVASVWHYPAQIDMSKPEVNLKDGFQGMLSALPGSDVKYMRMGDFEGFKALDFQVKNDDIYFQGKLVLVHNTLYQIFTVYKASEEESMKTDFEHFIDSFKLHDPDQHKLEEGKTTKEKLNRMSV